MTASIAGLWRHPIKSHGREALDRITLTAGQTLPGDRLWAVAHERSDATGSEWVHCGHFSRGAKLPGLMAINARLDDTTDRVTLQHPALGELTLNPDTEGDKLIEWTRPLVESNDRLASSRVIRAQTRGMTDTTFASVSLGNLSTHRAVAQKLGRDDLSEKRWRINIWLDGLAPWEEFDWMGRELQIGGAKLVVRERIERCMATTANPETGKRDADTLAALQSWGHQDMGMYAEVTETGEVAMGDEVKVL